MKLWRKLFGKNDTVENSIRSLVSPPSVKSSESLDERIIRLWASVNNLGWSNEERQRAIAICTDLINLVDEHSTEYDICDFLRNRAISYRSIENYDATLEDLVRELEISQEKGNHIRVMKCRELIEETKDTKRLLEIEAVGGDKHAKLQAMEKLAQELWSDGPAFETAFADLFDDMENPDPDVRFDAVRLLSNSRDALERLVSIYQECEYSDPWRASIAGRVLGRKIPKSDLMTNAETTNLMYGISASFIHCPCAHCNHRNRGIIAPPNGSMECFYTQSEDKGAYTVPVLCDRCGEKFFVEWDSDPR